jgi:hypothetical protein
MTKAACRILVMTFDICFALSQLWWQADLSCCWLGHKDGGILIGKVYGHLLDEHRQKMAAKLTIGLAPVPDTPRLEVVQDSL